MTSRDSFKTSGILNQVPLFDRISEQGILFTNFFSNSFFTEGGLISLLTGCPPVQYPGASYTIYGSYRQLDSPIEEYQKAGYQTGFISSATLSFQNKNQYLRGLGFSSVEGLDETPEFANAQRNYYGFEATSDRVLYETSLTRIKNYQSKKDPFLFVVETTSSHMDYQDEQGNNVPEDVMWHYVDNEFNSFYKALVDQRFFENGIMIATGDHHKLMPPNSEARKKYGNSAGSRVPLLIVGKGVPRGRVDERLFQQSDLFRLLFDVGKEHVPLSSFVTAVRPHQKPLIGENWSKLWIFTPSGLDRYFQMLIKGKEQAWVDAITPRSRSY